MVCAASSSTQISHQFDILPISTPKNVEEKAPTASAAQAGTESMVQKVAESAGLVEPAATEQAEEIVRAEVVH